MPLDHVAYGVLLGHDAEPGFGVEASALDVVCRLKQCAVEGGDEDAQYGALQSLLHFCGDEVPSPLATPSPT